MNNIFEDLKAQIKDSLPEWIMEDMPNSRKVSSSHKSADSVDSVGSENIKKLEKLEMLRANSSKKSFDISNPMKDEIIDFNITDKNGSTSSP